MDFSENFLKRSITAAILTLAFLATNILYFETFLLLLVVSSIALLKEWWELSVKWNGYFTRSVISFLVCSGVACARLVEVYVRRLSCILGCFNRSCI